MRYLSESAKKKRKEYNVQYQKDFIIRRVLKFNRLYEEDLIEWLDGIDNRNNYLKELIRRDMEKCDRK